MSTIDLKEFVMTINALRTENLSAQAVRSTERIDMSKLSAAETGRLGGRGGSANANAVKTTLDKSGESTATGKPAQQLVAQRPTRTREQFETWFNKSENQVKIAKMLLANNYGDPGPDGKMIGGLTYIGTSGYYPKSIASVAGSLLKEVFQASAKLDAAKSTGNKTKINDAIYDFNAARSDAFKYFNKYVIKDPNPGLKLPGNPPTTEV
jgi:hypothetical protein